MIEETLDKLIFSSETAIDHAHELIEVLFDNLATSISSRDYTYSSEYKNIITDIKRHGAISDSAEYLQSVICDSNKSAILEFNLNGKPRDLEYLNSWFQENLNDHKINSRPYVYMSWRMRPEEYMYVGKGKTSSRVNLITHGKLLESLKHATYFAMLFPKPATNKIVSNLEASIINLIQYKTGTLPKHNKRNETFSIQDLQCDSQRMDISELLEKISRDLVTC